MWEARLCPKAGLQAREHGWKMDDLVIQAADMPQGRYTLMGIKILCQVGQKLREREVEIYYLLVGGMLHFLSMQMVKVP
jgi:hypothetical protein